VQEGLAAEERPELGVRPLEHLCAASAAADLLENRALYLSSPEMAVVLATRVQADVCPTGGTEHKDVSEELGIWPFSAFL
jgi:hypothetical protein